MLGEPDAVELLTELAPRRIGDGEGELAELVGDDAPIATLPPIEDDDDDEEEAEEEEAEEDEE